MAKEAELLNWKKNCVYERVEDSGQHAISSRWVYSEKSVPGSDVTKLKARLVCRGYEEDSSWFRTDSPTCTKESLRLVSCATMSYGWECKSLDVKAAFLQGFDIEREIYMRPPSDIREKGFIWKLRRCPYGLNDAPRSWFRRVKSELDKLGVRSSIFDEALFYYKVEGHLAGLMALHVDDFIYGGSTEFTKDVISKLVSVFEISVQNCSNFKYVGLNLVQTSNGIMIDQDKYVKSTVECVDISSSRVLDKDELLTEVERKQLKRLCGQLLWVSNNTRPDVCYEVSTLCNAGKNATVSDLLKVNKLVKKMKQEKGVIKYPNLGDPNKWNLAVFSDSSFANLPDSSSQGGHIVFINSTEGKVAPISWQSRKLQRVTKSTLSSETLAVIEAVDAAVLIQKQIEEVFEVKPEIIVYTDSQSLHQTVHTSKILTDKSLRISVAYLRQFINNREITMNWIRATYQLADSLTKSGAASHQLMQVLQSGYIQ